MKNPVYSQTGGVAQTAPITRKVGERDMFWTIASIFVLGVCFVTLMGRRGGL